LNLRLASPTKIYQSTFEATRYYAQSTFEGFIDKLITKFLKKYDSLFDKKFPTVSDEKRESVKRNTFSRIDALYDLVINGTEFVTGITRKTNKKTSDTSTNTVEVAANTKFGISNLLPFLNGEVAPSVRNEKETNDDMSEEDTFTIEKTLNFSLIRENISELITAMPFDRVYICIDELWAIDRGRERTVQPLFLEYMKRTMFHQQSITLKFASIRETTNLNSKLSVENNYGIQSDHDIYEAFNLDTLRINPGSRSCEFIEILAQRINFFGNSSYEVDYIKKAIFNNKLNYETLVELSGGIPRSFLNILKLALEAINYKLRQRFIDSKLLTEIAIKKHDTSHRSDISLVSDSIYKTVYKYISSTSSNFFIINNSQFNRLFTDINSLVFNEILHRIPSDLTPPAIKNEYKAFLIEGGFYLSVIKSVNKDKYQSIQRKFQHKLPENLDENYTQFIIDLDKLESEYIECKLCSKRIPLRHPVYVKYKICPECANDEF